MGKITKKATEKHKVSLSPALVEFIEKTCSLPLVALPSHLSTLPTRWPFPRGDLYNWIEPLDRFDSILQNFNERYGLSEGPQTQTFGLSIISEDSSGSDEKTLRDAGFSQDGDRELIEAILSFSRLLLEKCGNRALYNSSDRLNDLLNTTSLSLLHNTLRITVFLAQRFSERPSNNVQQIQFYSFNNDKLNKLASSFAPNLPLSPKRPPLTSTKSAKGKEKGAQAGKLRRASTSTSPNDFRDLLRGTAEDTANTDQDWQQWANVKVTWTPSIQDVAQSDQPNDASTSQGMPTTPTPVRRQPSSLGRMTSATSVETPVSATTNSAPGRSGLQKVEYSATDLSQTSIDEFLCNVPRDMPQLARYELLHKLRVAYGLTASTHTRRTLLAIRLLALAVLAYIYDGNDFPQKVFGSDASSSMRSQLIQQIVSLVQNTKKGQEDIPLYLQTLGMETLAVLARQRSLSSDITVALAPNSSHGLLLSLTQKGLADLKQDGDETDNATGDEWREAISSLLSAFMIHGVHSVRASETVIHPSLISTYASGLEIMTEKALRVHLRILDFMKSFFHQFKDGLTVLSTNKAFEAACDLLGKLSLSSLHLLDEGQGMPEEFKTKVTDYQIPYMHQQVIRSMIDLINDVVGHQGGHAERIIRNLVDSQSLLNALHLILSNIKAFGAHTWSEVVKAICGFLHNEPTSYTIISEAGIIKTLLDMVNSSTRATSAATERSVSDQPTHEDLNIPASSDAIVNLSQAFSAICLTNAGFETFQSSGVLEKFFEIFESPAHVKVIKDSNTLALLGSTFAEFIRHHAALRPSIVSAVITMMARVRSICRAKAWETGAGAKLWLDDGLNGTVSGGAEALVQELVPSSSMQASEPRSIRLPNGNTLLVHSHIGRVDPALATLAKETNSDGLTTIDYARPAVCFLMNFLETQQSCVYFMDHDVTDIVLDYITLPAMSPDDQTFGRGAIAHELALLVHMMAETKPYLVLPVLADRANYVCTEGLAEFSRNQPASFHCYFAPFVQKSEQQIPTGPPGSQASNVLNKGTGIVKGLTTLYFLTNVLSEIFNMPIFNSRASSVSLIFLQVHVADILADICQKLGEISAACCREEIALQRTIPESWLPVTKPGGFSTGDDEVDKALSVRADPSDNVGAEGEQSEHQARTNHEILKNEKQSVSFKNVQTLRYLLIETPAAISEFFQRLGRGIVTKRRMDQVAKQKSNTVARALAEAYFTQLRPAFLSMDVSDEDSKAKEARFAYLLVSLAYVRNSLTDDSPNNNNASGGRQSLVIEYFRKAGGVKRLVAIGTELFEELKSCKVAHSMFSANTGLKHCLDILDDLTSHKNICESSQGLGMVSINTAKDHYFNPSQLLLELRMEALQLTRKIWDSEYADQASTDVVTKLISILKHVFNGDSETDAVQSLSEYPRISTHQKRKFAISNEVVSTISNDKGFPKSLVREAMYRTNCTGLSSTKPIEEYCTALHKNPRRRNLTVPDGEIDDSDSSIASSTPGPATLPFTGSTTIREGGGNGSGIEATLAEVVSNIGDDDMDDVEDDLMQDRVVSAPEHTSSAMDLSNILNDPEGPVAQSRAHTSTSEAGPPLFTIETIDAERESIREELADRCNNILNNHQNLTFELSALMISATKKLSNDARRAYWEGTCDLLINALLSRQAEEGMVEAEGKKIAAAAHLIGLLIQDNDVFKPTMKAFQESFDGLLAFLRLPPITTQNAEDSPSPWVAQILLVLERMLSHDADPPGVKWSAPNDMESCAPARLEHTALFDVGQKKELFEILMMIVPRVGKDQLMARSIVRALVILTRVREIAILQGQRANLQRLFLMVKQLGSRVNNPLQNSFMLILRHVIEDQETIRQIMESEVAASFHGRTANRAPDLTTYVRDNYALVLRAPQTFVNVSKEKIKLTTWSQHSSTSSLALKEAGKDQELSDGQQQISGDSSIQPANQPAASIETIAEAKTESEKSKGIEVKPPVVEHPDGVVHFLLSELLTYENVEDKEPPQSSESKSPDSDADPGQKSAEDLPEGQQPAVGTESAIAITSAKQDKAKFKADDHPIFLYRCFILHCLTELLYCYNRTKIEFINFSRKADPMVVTPSKPRSGILNYLLNALVSSGYVDKDETITCKKRMVLSDWAMKVVIALCTKTGEMGLAGPAQRFQPQAQVDDQDTEPDLAFVRRFALEHAIKAFKDATASVENLQAKYGRLLCLADLFRRLLTKPAGPDIAAGSHNNSYKILGRMMFEKNLISVLTSSLAEIDLSFPSAKKVIKFILRPLQELTSLATYLSINSPETITSVMSNDVEDVISSASSVSDLDDEREETPDLFRNSALGMLDPGRQDGSDAFEDEDEDEEMYDEEYGDEMEYDDDAPLPNDGEVISDEEIDEGMEGPGHMEGLPGDMPMDIEFVVNGPHDMPSDEDDEDDSEDDEEDDEDDSDEDDENDDFEIEMDDEGEINADNENDSLGDGQEDENEWEDEDGMEGDEDDDDEGDVDVTFGGEDLPLPIDVGTTGGPHAELNTLLRVLGEQDLDSHIMPPPPQHLVRQVQDDLDQDDEDEEEGEDGEDMDDHEMDFDDEFNITADGLDDLDTGGQWDTFDEPPPFIRRHRHSNGFGRHGMPNFVSRRIHALGDHDLHHQMGIRHHRHPPPPRNGADDGMNPLLQQPESGLTSRAAFEGQPSMFNSFDSGLFGPLGAIVGDGMTGVPISMDLPLGGAGGGGENSNFSALGAHGAVLDAIVQALQRGDRNFLQTGRLATGGIQVHVNTPFSGVRGAMRNMASGVHGRQPKEDPGRAASFTPATTVTRWQEEARILFGNTYIDKVQRVQIWIMSELVPPAQAEEQQRRIKRAEEEERRKKEVEEAEKRWEEEERLRKEQAEREAAERAEAEARARAEAEAAAAAAAASEVEQTSEVAEVMEDVQTSEQQNDGDNVGEGAAEQARIFTTIRGRRLDITGLSIDLEYLEALPEELREEVITQQYTERREHAQEEGGDVSAIDPDFLDALPEDIREEIRQQEAHLARRRQREEARRQAQQDVGAVQAEDMDNDNFLATLDPALRRAILAEQPPEILSQLDPRHAAEGRAQQRGLFFNRLTDRGPRLDDRTRRDAVQKDSKRQVVQLIDKAGVATLLRLMFLPQQGSLRQNLWSILGHVCGNRQTRFEVVSLLLVILKEGSTDVNAVERSLASLSLRAKATAAQKTPQPLKRTLSMPAQNSISEEMTPMTVVQQCLAALHALCRLGYNVKTIFLREVDVGPSRSVKKGKGKENKTVKFPINDLISLLDRRLIMDSSSCLQALAELLASVTSPLSFLMKKDKEQNEEEKKKDDPARESQVQGETALADANEVTIPAVSGGDTAMAEAPAEAPIVGQDASVNTTQEQASATEEPNPKSEGEDANQDEKKKPFEPPAISEHNLKLVTGVFVAPECHNETFHCILETLSHLSCVPETSTIFSKELINHVQKLSQAICTDLDDLLPLIKEAQSTSDLQGITSAKFSAGSSDQVKLLRVLQALDYLSAPKKDSEAEDDSTTVKSILNSSYDTLSLGPLWNKLSDCLTAVREKGDTIGFANILLPLIESLMVVCKNTPLKDAPVTGQAQEAINSGPVAEEMNDLEELFFRFTAEHRKILNDIVRQNPKLMQGNGNFSLLVKNSKVLDFDNKRNYFTKQIHSRQHQQRHVQPPLQLSARRDHVFADSFKSLYFKSAEEMKYGKLNIRFLGEEGVDAGGVTREWFHILARGMFDANYALFQPVASDRTTFHPNPLSGVNEQHLSYFKFIGRIIGKALHEGRVLDCHFSRAVYKRILGKSPNLKDLESNDVDYYKSLVWILENDITDILTEEFCVIENEFGVDKVVDLIPDGRNIAVTEQNKKEYVQKLVEYRLTESVKDQLDNFLQGFHDIIPAELIAIFNEQELELLISGLPEIDVDDWKANTEYHNYSPSSPQVVWFWRIVRGMSNEERAKLLQFITGTSKVPLNGFKELEGVSGLTRHNIHKDPSTTRLPTSHTCFNQLDLPAYESFELMKQNLMTAISLGADYFGFA